MPLSARSSNRTQHSKRLHKFKKQAKENSPSQAPQNNISRRTRAALSRSDIPNTSRGLDLQRIALLEAEIAGLRTSLLEAESCYFEATKTAGDLETALTTCQDELRDLQRSSLKTSLQLDRYLKKVQAQRKGLARARLREGVLIARIDTLQEDAASAETRSALASLREKEAQSGLARALQETSQALLRADRASSDAFEASEVVTRFSAMVDSLTRENMQLSEMLESISSKAATLRQDLDESRKRLKATQMRCTRAVCAREKAKKRANAANIARRQALNWKLTQGQMYSPEARSLARLLQKAGCSQTAVGPTIVAIGQVFGIKVNRTMSRRTVQRASIEGGLASRIQVAYELSQADGFTASGDGTTHQKINYEAWHVNVLVPSSYSDKSAPLSHRTCLIGVDQALDHSSETQVAGWKEHVNSMSGLLAETPFAEREGVVFKADDFARKIKGMHGDHASDQLKTACAIEAWKKNIMISDLGWQRLADMSPEEVDKLSADAISAERDAAGGEENWLALDNDVQKQRIDSALARLALDLGASAFADLSCDSQQNLSFFVRGGCCMHKDLNSVKGGNDMMQAEWHRIQAQPPMLLANKVNAATIEVSRPSDPAARLATDVSARGVVKLTSLAGAIFNNKDDKKGHQDYHRWFFEDVKRRLDGTKFSVKFPSTSNTRFQSHCKAAVELIAYLKQYIEFLEHVHDHKEKHSFNHIEQNVYDALHDNATLTELAVLVIYAEAITHPYMHAIRGPGVESINLLDLGPLHRDLCSHIAYLIENPDVILNPAGEDPWKKAALDGEDWEDPKAMAAVYSLKSEMPHLEPMLVAFLKGALETWQRFSAEFVPGGLIDTASPSEKHLAFMPSTNDPNEGALGQMRVRARNNPNETAQNSSAKAAFHRNGTQDFMDAKFKMDDHLFLMRKAREVDSSKLAKKFRTELMERLCTAVQEKRANDERRAAKQTELFQKLGATELVQDEKALLLLNVKQLDLQLEVYRVVKQDKEVPIKARLKNKDLKRAALIAALARSKSSTNLELGNDLSPAANEEPSQSEPDLLLDEDDETELYYQK